MRVLSGFAALSFAGIVLSGCMMSTEDKDLEGITLGGGDAIAINSSLQIIDPWPAGVQDTDLVVPADRGKKPPAAGGDGADDGGGNETTALSG